MLGVDEVTGGKRVRRVPASGACRHRAEQQRRQNREETDDCSASLRPALPSTHLESSPLASRREEHFLPGSNAPKQVGTTRLAAELWHEQETREARGERTARVG